ncbi:hypothetical protein JXB28_02015 [Candidatus Woesearchaeota archaeon]|nr:hypothetical protein [Candidatus Woesearchaeota archaeon]
MRWWVLLLAMLVMLSAACLAGCNSDDAAPISIQAQKARQDHLRQNQFQRNH